MKNLELFSEYPELSKTELREVNGGFVCGGLCVAGVIILAGMAGVAVGYGIAYLMD